MWPRQPRLDSWCGQISSLRVGAPPRYGQQRCWRSTHDPASCCSRSHRRNGETSECESAVPAFGDDCKYAHAPPGFSRLTASIREVLQSQLKIQTFFQERCTWLNSPCIFSQDCWARSREFATLLNHLPLVDPDTIAWQKVPQQDSLRLPFPKKMIMQSGSKQEHCQ